MDNWIETAAGNLIKASSTTIIGVREDKHDGTWEVTVSVATSPVSFATGLASCAAARAIRNALAVNMSTPGMNSPCALFFDDHTVRVAAEPLTV